MGPPAGDPAPIAEQDRGIDLGLGTSSSLEADDRLLRGYEIEEGLWYGGHREKSHRQSNAAAHTIPDPVLFRCLPGPRQRWFRQAGDERRTRIVRCSLRLGRWIILHRVFSP